MKFANLIKKFKKTEDSDETYTKEYLQDCINNTNMPEGVKELVINSLDYLIDDASIVTELSDKLTIWNVDIVEHIDKIQDDRYPVEYLNFYSGKIDMIKTIALWLNKQLGNNNEDLDLEEITIVKAEDVFGERNDS